MSIITFLKPDAVITADDGTTRTAQQYHETRQAAEDTLFSVTEEPLAYQEDPVIVEVLQFETDEGRIHHSMPNDPTTKVWFQWDDQLAWCLLGVTEDMISLVDEAA